MTAPARFKVGDLVRIGKGRRVYQVDHVHEGRYRVAATAWHPDAATRAPDSLRLYSADELTKAAASSPRKRSEQ